MTESFYDDENVVHLNILYFLFFGTSYRQELKSALTFDYYNIATVVVRVYDYCEHCHYSLKRYIIYQFAGNKARNRHCLTCYVIHLSQDNKIAILL